MLMFSIYIQTFPTPIMIQYQYCQRLLAAKKPTTCFGRRAMKMKIRDKEGDQILDS
jgi:hypothetical protein